MECPNLAEQIKAAGYGLALTDDWQQVKVSGDSRLPEPMRSQLKADKEQVRAWLKAEYLAQRLDGKIVNVSDLPPAYWAKYPAGRNGSASSPAPKNRLLDSWLGCADAILSQRDDKGRHEYTHSEVDSCIIALRGLSQPEAKQTLQRLQDALPEARKCTNRLMAAAKRKRKQNEKKASE